jgi:hypothetical protein
MMISKTSLLRGMLCFFLSQILSTAPIDLNWAQFPYPLFWVSVTTFLAVCLLTEAVPQSTQFNPEGSGSMFFWNISIHLQDYMFPQPRRPPSEQSLVWKPSPLSPSDHLLAACFITDPVPQPTHFNSAYGGSIFSITAQKTVWIISAVKTQPLSGMHLLPYPSPLFYYISINFINFIDFILLCIKY